MKSDPVPFEITEVDATHVASNGDTTLTLLDSEGKMFRRRAIKGLSMAPCAETAIPHINQLAGELLANLDMPAHVVAQRLADIATRVQPLPAQKVEWVVAELGDVRVYMTARDVIGTRRALHP